MIFLLYLKNSKTTYQQIPTQKYFTSAKSNKWLSVFKAAKKKGLGIDEEKQCHEEKCIQQKIVPINEVRRFIFDCLSCLSCNPKNADIVVDNLITADFRGHSKYGLSSLPDIIKQIESKTIRPNSRPTVDIQNQATAIVNGEYGLGPVNGKYCMDLAIRKASSSGVALVSCYRSNNFGIPSMYTLQAIKKGFIAVVASNSIPLVVPTRACDVAYGTNPISFGAPGEEGDYFLLDLATSATSLQNIESYRRKGQSIPEGWAMGKEGQAETDPANALKIQKLMPLGGLESTGGYKGFGLGLMVEILAGCLSGSAYGLHMRERADKNRPLNVGHVFLAINPKAFCKETQSRIYDLMTALRNLKPLDPNKPVLIPGDSERLHMRLVRKQGGLSYSEEQLVNNLKLAEKLKIQPIQPL